ncbi:hypothetical protein GCM10017044_21670 [Kordiimonas sediminis]|uniref:histidine kinase n=1 Tax=Kordiimonas sediminis TaxID=1735581 RepID=A0A919AW01_9PROT|nr:ATP-binding protein [Kordiimonas sediminis]GHF26391.1 hypothetical protein GCM10017044_21670 [Kordiimonas sediminis]
MKPLPESMTARLLRAVSDAVIIINDQSIIQDVNPATEDLFGYSEAELLGQPIGILMPAKYRDSHAAHVGLFAKSDTNFVARTMRPNVPARTRDGRSLDLDITIQKHIIDGKQVFTAICRDVSEIKQRIEALQISEARLARAQRIAQLGNWEWDIRSGDLLWSVEIYRIFGRDPFFFEATYDNFLECIHEEDRDRVAQKVSHCLKTGEEYEIIHRIACPSGEIKVVQERGDVLYDEKGNPVRMDGTVQDITPLYEREMRIRDLAAKAEVANAAKSQLLAIMSHELRTPLNAIIGMSELMQNEVLGPLDSRYIEYAHDIQESGRQLFGHINNILASSSFDLGSIRPKRLTLMVPELIDQIIKHFAHPLANKKIDLRVERSDHFDEMLVDPVHTHQILINLISNAIKFSEEGSTIILRLSETETSYTVSVQDFGIGFSLEALSNLLQPFTQIQMETSRSYEGLGLGLSIVKGLAEAQGGNLDIDSEPGQGTTCTVLLPKPETEDVEDLLFG